MKIGFVSLGCPKNLVDSEVMMGLSQEGGHTLTPNPADADVLVVNTCAFIDSAKEESVNTILELAEFKKTGNCKRLVVTGCLGERYRDELKAQIPEIDAVLGTGDVPEIVGAIEGAKQKPHDSAHARSVPNPQSLIPNPFPRTCTTPSPLASSPHRGISPTSRWPRAATTSARSASSRRCAATTAAARSTRSSAKRDRSRRAACAS